MRDQPDEVAEALAGFAYELGLLKRIRRSGWWQVGVRDPESVADHSLRVAQLATVLAALEGSDPSRAALLAVWHDSQETRIGDIPHTARPYLEKPAASTIAKDQTQHLPEHASKAIQEAVSEYEEQRTGEARCAKDADRLECILQAMEYRHAGHANVQGWIDSSRESLTTDSARRIADAALHTSPLAWRGR